MPRANLGDLLGALDTAPSQVAAQPPAPAKQVSAKPEVTVSEGSGPEYLRFVRKDIRLRADQLAALTDHARRLSRAKATGTPRVTENTLIRIAIDLLLERVERASGDSEDDLRRSLL